MVSSLLLIPALALHTALLRPPLGGDVCAVRKSADATRPWSPSSLLTPLLSVACATTFALSAPASFAATAPAPELQLRDFSASGVVTEGLAQAGMEGDLRMMKLWARLKAGQVWKIGFDPTASALSPAPVSLLLP